VNQKANTAFTKDNLAAVLKFEWHKVLLTYVVGFITLGTLILGIWGHFKDKHD
jgi:hypothetical protein